MASTIARVRSVAHARRNGSQPSTVVPKKAERRRPRAKRSAEPVPPRRISTILRALLEENDDRSFTVEKISRAMGSSSFGASLLVFSIPEVVPLPLPGLSAVVALPTATIATQMIAGRREVRLPKWLLKRRVPRKALAAAVRAVLPILERAERTTRARGRWVTHPITQRLLGVFIFVLALLIALPVPGTNVPPALAIFITALGMVERDGWAIALGVLLGLASIALIGGIALGMLKLVKKYIVPALPV